jgi:O-antigen/teichoic acid export membrane protein
VSLSMLLRDVAPVLALGGAALWAAEPDVVVWRAAVALAVFCAVSLLFGAMRYGAGAARDRTDAQQGSLWLSSILGMGQAQADLVIAGLFLPVEVFGLYALLRRVANLVALPVTVATWVCAGPVARAFTQGDGDALARATAQASAIAWYPALGLLILAGIGAVGLGMLQLPFLPSDMLPVFAVLLGGALLQAWWAASYPVANLGPTPAMAVEARGIALILYSLMAFAGGAELGALGHALAYTLAMAAGGFHLWRRLWRAFAVDTSARVLWRQAGTG